MVWWIGYWFSAFYVRDIDLQVFINSVSFRLLNVFYYGSA
jgi:hypothetical protein